jgi:hypothetical protein
VELQAILSWMRADLGRLIAEAGPTRMDLPGAAGDWTLKNVIAHLTFWRWWSVRRLEAAVRDQVPVPPWDARLDENVPAVVDRINQQAYEATRDRSIAEVLRDSQETFDRAEAALLALSETDIFEPNRYLWLGGAPVAAIVHGSAGHLREHKQLIDDFLARAEPRG